MALESMEGCEGRLRGGEWGRHLAVEHADVTTVGVQLLVSMSIPEMPRMQGGPALA